MYRYVFKIKLNNPSDEESFITHWKNASKILQEYDGALGTHIHAVQDEPGSFFFVAEWESQEARDAMDHDTQMGESERAKRWQQFPENETFGEVISFAGEEFDAVKPELKL